MKRLKTSRFLLVIAGALFLAACYESPGVTRHEPGEYKGVTDPLLAKLENDGELRDQLDQRFDGQRDR